MGEVLAEADEAFWAVIQKNFRYTSGDLDPMAAVKQYERNLFTILIWLKDNATGEIAEEAAIWLRELLRDRA